MDLGVFIQLEGLPASQPCSSGRGSSSEYEVVVFLRSQLVVCIVHLLGYLYTRLCVAWWCK